MNIFVNEIYAQLEFRAKNATEENIDDIIRDIREASLYGKIQSFEEIHLMDLLDLKQADDIDSDFIEEKDTGIRLEEQEVLPDMSYLDDYEEEVEKKEEGFLGFLNE